MTTGPPHMIELSESTRMTAAVLLLSLVTVETGGVYLIRLIRGSSPATSFQQAFARAGHAHAGVLLILALVCLLYTEIGALGGVVGGVARVGVPAAALLMPAGFFFSSLGAGRSSPSRWIVLVYLGAACLAAGLVSLAIGLLQAGQVVTG
jgi:hypothetical protein